jgi:hypothetical protein
MSRGSPLRNAVASGTARSTDRCFLLCQLLRTWERASACGVHKLGFAYKFMSPRAGAELMHPQARPRRAQAINLRRTDAQAAESPRQSVWGAKTRVPPANPSLSARRFE